ncbi:hypothetical protein R9C00_16400 [Flammeovirgaceae bacterium SG7u.111]|nr:hypothetical protein [Flammeovirgaceae bacterium SG7u.132]WPO33284.1 hypothetical protein R9C00_16400 [Flammeovirgaceae bacterium SG7u.111]
MITKSNKYLISILLAFLSGLGPILAQAQDEQAELEKKQPADTLTSKWGWGGGFGFSSSTPSSLALSPSLEYAPAKAVRLGAGILAGYKQGGNEAPSTWDIGGRLYGDLLFHKNLPWLQVGYKASLQPDSLGKKDWIHSGTLGIGYSMEMQKGKQFRLLLSRDFFSDKETDKLTLGDWNFGVSLAGGLGRKQGGGKPFSSFLPSLKPNFQKRDTAKDTRSFKERIIFGGDFSLSPDKENSSMRLSPMVGYEPNKFSSFGIGATLSHMASKEKDDESLKEEINYGYRIFGRISPVSWLPYAQAELEGMSNTDSLENKDFGHTWLLGGGYKFSIGALTSLNASVLRDMGTAPGESPWVFRMGIEASLGNPGGQEGWIDGMKEKPFTPGMMMVAPILKKLGLEGNFSIIPGDPARVDISPIFNIKLDSMFTLGIGPSVQMSQDMFEKEWDFSKLDYGGRVYARFQPKKKAPYVQLEYEGIGALDSLEKRKLLSSVLFGAGYSAKLPLVGNISLTVLRDLTYSGPTKTHGNPWVFRMGLGKKLPFEDKPIPGTRAPIPVKDGFDLYDLEGNLGLSLGELMQVDLSPAFSYNIKKWWNAATGPVFRYAKDNSSGRDEAIYGARAFTRVLPKYALPHLHFEGEALNSGLDTNGKPVDRQWHMALLLGGGLNFPIGDKAAINITALRKLGWDGPTPIHREKWDIRMGLKI